MIAYPAKAVGYAKGQGRCQADAILQLRAPNVERESHTRLVR